MVSHNLQLHFEFSDDMNPDQIWSVHHDKVKVSCTGVDFSHLSSGGHGVKVNCTRYIIYHIIYFLRLKFCKTKNSSCSDAVRVTSLFSKYLSLGLLCHGAYLSKGAWM